MGSVSAAQVENGCRELLDQAGIVGKVLVEPIAGGRNNRVFKVVCRDVAYLLKVYFRHVHDPRDRLNTEFGFISFAWNGGIHAVPRPFACNPVSNMALYEYVRGQQPAAGRIDERFVHQSIAFFKALNRLRRHPQACRLPVASEGCFSLHGHVATVDKRIQTLLQMPRRDDPSRRAARIVENELVPAWQRCQDRLWAQARRMGINALEELAVEQRCLSPSDFGAHNAIEENGGSYRFIDFEYAGWDDPAKTVNDFFCQPQVPIPPNAYRPFLQSIAELFPRAEALIDRAWLLLPLYRIKWCCIMMNDFLPVGNARRRYAGGQPDRQRKAAQIEKIRAMLNRGLQEATMGEVRDGMG